MRVKLQLVMCSDEGDEKTITDVITLNKNSHRIEHLGLTLAEAKQLLSTLQQHLLQHQVDTFLDPCFTCADCGARLKVKAHTSRLFRQTSPKSPLHMWIVEVAFWRLGKRLATSKRHPDSLLPSPRIAPCASGQPFYPYPITHTRPGVVPPIPLQ